MEPLYFDDYGPETTLTTLGRTLTETDIVMFVGLANFYEPLFMDQEYLRAETAYSGRLVPGPLVYSIAEGLILQTGVLHNMGIAFLGVDLRISKPTCAGDTIHVEVTLASKRETSKEDRGIVTTNHRILNQRDEEVMRCTVTRMVRRRPRSS